MCSFCPILTAATRVQAHDAATGYLDNDPAYWWVKTQSTGFGGQVSLPDTTLPNHSTAKVISKPLWYQGIGLIRHVR